MISTSQALAHDGHAHPINFNELTYLPNFDATANPPLNVSTIFLATLFVLILLIAMVKVYRTNKLSLDVNPSIECLSKLIVGQTTLNNDRANYLRAITCVKLIM